MTVEKGNPGTQAPHASPAAAPASVGAGTQSADLRRHARGAGFASGAAALRPGAVAGPQASARPTGSASVQQRVEQATGTRLGDVRVHDDPAAHAAAAEFDARAFTVGRDIYFGAGEHRPGSPAGDRLMAHELAHVVQQGSAGGGAQPQLEARATSPGDAAEAEADAVADAAMSGSVGAVQVSSRPRGVARAVTTDPVKSPPRSLADYGDDRRSKLDIDTANIDIAAKDYFGKTGLITYSPDLDPHFQLVGVNVALHESMKAFVLGVFAMLPQNRTDKDPPILNRTNEFALDLSSWNGPNALFRFTSVDLGKEGKKQKVHLLVENLGAAALPKAPDAKTITATEDTLKRAGIVPDATMGAAKWKRFAKVASAIPESLLLSVSDVTVKANASPKGPDGEAGQFSTVHDGKANTWVRTLTLYADAFSGSDEALKLLVAHELGHGIDSRTAELATGKYGKDRHDSKEFEDAVKADGGWSHAPTAYAKTSHKEFYCECFSLWIGRKATFATLFPKVSAYFDKLGADAAAASATKAGASPGTLKTPNPNDPLAGLGLL